METNTATPENTLEEPLIPQKVLERADSRKSFYENPAFEGIPRTFSTGSFDFRSEGPEPEPDILGLADVNKSRTTTWKKRINAIGMGRFITQKSMNRERKLQQAWTKKNTYESFDWTTVENNMRADKYYRMEPGRLVAEQKKEWRIEAARWMLCMVIGALMGVTGFLINLLISSINELKYKDIISSINSRCRSDYDHIGTSDDDDGNGSVESVACKSLTWITALGINVPLVLMATYVCFVYAPSSAGSGIGEVKCYLNGVKKSGWLDISTFGSKIFGVICLCSANMPVGKEGPMIHIGSIIGAAVAQGRIRNMFGVNWDSPIHWFRNDRSKRDFASCGAASGLATAFGASIGGVLFVLEEGASFPNQGLVWRSLFTATTALLVLNSLTLAMNSDTGTGNLNAYSMFSFGTFPDSAGTIKTTYTNGTVAYEQSPPLWELRELPIFCAIGLLGGLLGALWNQTQSYLGKFRLKHRKTLKWALVEAFLIVLLNTSVLYLLSMYVNTCEPICTGNSNSTACQGTEKKLPDWILTTNREGDCPQGQYSSFGTLTMNELGIAVRKFFHIPPGLFSFKTCGLFFVTTYVMSCLTYGGAYPSGLFVPCIATGAALGRFFGEAFAAWGYPVSYIGTYSVMGAAAVLGGVTRVTISLTAVFCEATNQVTFIVPITVVLILSKFVADLFNLGIYDVHIQMKKIPFLEWKADTSIRRYHCEDACTSPVISFSIRPTVFEVMTRLQTTQHNSFLIVKNTEDGDVFQGIILRHQLYTMFVHKLWGERAIHGPGLTADQFDSELKLDINSDIILVAPNDHELLMDLSQYYDPTVLTVMPETPLERAYDMFRYLGIRHLPVVDENRIVKGIMTRHDLDEHAVHELNEHFYKGR